MRAALALVIALVAACGDNEPALLANGSAYSVTWSGGTSSSVGAVTCTETISHPCPWLLYADAVTIDETRSTRLRESVPVRPHS